jgi:hypothetical protein
MVLSFYSGHTISHRKTSEKIKAPRKKWWHGGAVLRAPPMIAVIR